MGVIIASKMIVLVSVLASLVLVSQAVSPMTPEELRQIRDFTAKAHMKRLQNYPDQLMTPSTHYLGRRLPNVEKQPTIFMQAPTNNAGVAAVKPTPFQIEPQQAGAVQNYLVNYPITTNTIAQQPQQGQIFQQRPPQQQPGLQFLQNGGPLNGPPRGPPPPRRPSFFSFGGPESSPPTSLLEFFFPKRPARRPPSFRPPIRFEYPQTAHNPALVQHHQNLHNVMAQQHLITVQQQAHQAAQQSVVQPSTAPITAQSTTVKNTLNAQVNPTVIAPTPIAPVTNNPTVNAQIANSNAQLLQQQQQQQQQNAQAAQQFFQQQQQQQNAQAAQQFFNQQRQQQQFIPIHHPHHVPHLNQFHREVPIFGKPVGKPRPPQKYPPVGPAFVPQNRPGDDINYIQKYANPQADFSFLNFSPHVPPVIAGPTSTRFGSPVSFSNIEQMPFPFQHPQQLPMHMVVQSQEFPHYHFTTTFTAANPTGPAPPTPPKTIVNTEYIHPSMKTPEAQQGQVTIGQQAASVQTTSVRHTQRVKKIRPRPSSTVPTTTTPTTTTQSLGDIIFESAKETREFHDSATLAAPTISNPEIVVTAKPRKPKQHKLHQQQQQQQQQQAPQDDAGSLQKASVESSSVVFAPLLYTETNEPSIPTTSARPITSTLVSISTDSTTTREPYKPKVVKSKNVVEFHKSKNISPHHNHHYEKRVTASGSGLGAVTVEPLRITSTGTSAATASSSFIRSAPVGRVVTTSVTSRVVSNGPQNAHKRYRLRKVKVPNPEAIKANNNKTSTTSSSSSSSSSSTTNFPSTTPISTRVPRSTTTISSSTESSLTTTTV